MQFYMRCCLLLIPLWESVFFSMFCCTLLYVHSSFAIILKGKRELVALLSLFFLVSRDCCVALPRGAMDQSAVCDCGISWSQSLIIFAIHLFMILDLLNVLKIVLPKMIYFIGYSWSLLFPSHTGMASIRCCYSDGKLVQITPMSPKVWYARALVTLDILIINDHPVTAFVLSILKPSTYMYLQWPGPGITMPPYS